MLVFVERGKLEYPKKNISVQSREPTNSTHIWRRVWESNLGHIGGRRMLSPLRHRCTSWVSPVRRLFKSRVYFKTIFLKSVTIIMVDHLQILLKTETCLKLERRRPWYTGKILVLNNGTALFLPSAAFNRVNTLHVTRIKERITQEKYSRFSFLFIWTNTNFSFLLKSYTFQHV